MARQFAYRALFLFVVTSAAASGQFVIKKQPDIIFPEPPPIILGEEKDKGPERPPEDTTVYEGPVISLSTACDVDRLEYAGIRCNADRPCDLFLELVSSASEGNWVVLTGEVHTADATYESVVLSSQDGGLTWTESAERVLAGGIESISIVDAETAFVAGQQGDTATGEIPFLLVTDDGGESWETRMVTTGSEKVEGLVVAFQADTTSHGYLTLEQLAATGDPYRLYETYNGGRSWSIRQISADKPQIPGSRLALGTEDWSVRPDVASGEFIVAKRSSSELSGWAEQGRFAGAVGSCPLP
jgi:photosystem II stability/assembly factor-like uncharacterized protein